jgi:2-polyprenyl-3-methyl-5-hydroxy-6-metoxy-1,4-benzoquinol methylase
MKPPPKIIESDLPAQRRYYDRLWAEVPAAQLNAHERARRDAIEDALDWLAAREPPPWSIAEVGCGRGWLAGLVLARYGEVRALDLSPDSIAKAREAFPHVRFEARDLFSGTLETHDLVVSSEVIEHVSDQPAFVDLLVSAARPGGWLLVTTPNGPVAREYQRRPDFRPQPIENVLAPRMLGRLLERSCRIARVETFFFGQGDGLLQRLVRSGRMTPPLARRLRLGLYALVLAQRRE